MLSRQQESIDSAICTHSPGVTFDRSTDNRLKTRIVHRPGGRCNVKEFAKTLYVNFLQAFFELYGVQSSWI